jgi:hypothetical protein
LASFRAGAEICRLRRNTISTSVRLTESARRLLQSIEPGSRKRPQILDRFPRLIGSHENGLGIVAEQFKPPGDIGGVIGTGFIRDSERSTQKRRPYETNYLLDSAEGVIVEVEATPARLSQEIVAAKTMIDRTEACFALKAKRPRT